jgi:hypothetical protein
LATGFPNNVAPAPGNWNDVDGPWDAAAGGLDAIAARAPKPVNPPPEVLPPDAAARLPKVEALVNEPKELDEAFWSPPHAAEKEPAAGFSRSEKDGPDADEPNTPLREIPPKPAVVDVGCDADESALEAVVSSARTVGSFAARTSFDDFPTFENGQNNNLNKEDQSLRLRIT